MGLGGVSIPHPWGWMGLGACWERGMLWSVSGGKRAWCCVVLHPSLSLEVGFRVEGGSGQPSVGDPAQLPNGKRPLAPLGASGRLVGGRRVSTGI